MVVILNYIYPFAFRSGSVVAEFKLVFKTKVEAEKAFVPLKRGVKDGKMGPLNVDPESLKLIKGTKGNEILWGKNRKQNKKIYNLNIEYMVSFVSLIN